MKSESARPYLWMLCGCVVFAVMGALAHDLGDRVHLDWQLIAIARAFIPFAVVAAFSLASGTKLVLWRPPILWMRSIAGSISLVCTFYCLTRLAPSLVMTVTNVFPIWVALLSWPLEKEKPSPAVWLATITGVAGVFLIKRPGGQVPDNLPLFLALGASLATAVAMMGLHRLKTLETKAIVVHFSGVAVVFAVVSWILGGAALPHEAPDWSTWGKLLGVGLTATAGQVCLTKAFTTGPPTKVAIVGLSQIVFAMTLDKLWLGKIFDVFDVLGVALVIAPTAWVVSHRPPVKEVMAQPGETASGEEAIEASPYSVASEPGAFGEG